jgi:adenosylmethionine-8-amino-7-oxononanoate aminotransferase
MYTLVFVAADHGSLWGHFTELSAEPGVTMVRGRGSTVWSDDGQAYFDGLSSLYCVNVGHGRESIADAVSAQMRTLEYFPVWTYRTPVAAELADKVASLAPPGLNTVFFTSGGSESVESAWKLVRQYHRLMGKPNKYKVISRIGSYHGTTLGALSITGVASLKEPFEPLVPGGLHAAKVDSFHADVDPRQHALDCAEDVARLIEAEGADTIGAIFIEPVQNSGGCLVADPVYFARLRELCDEHDILLVSDETICSWGRLGTFFGCDAIGYRPDIITTAKGITSAYVPMGAVIASDRVVEAFRKTGVSFSHGLTFGGHPVAAAAALENIRIIEDEGLCEAAARAGAFFRAGLESLLDGPLVADVRGVGLFQAIELVSDKATKAPFSAEQTEVLKQGIPSGLLSEGLISRAIHRGAPVIQFAPPLISTEQELATAVETLRRVIADTASRL